MSDAVQHAREPRRRDPVLRFAGWAFGALAMSVYFVHLVPAGVRGRAYVALTLVELALSLVAFRRIRDARDVSFVLAVGIATRALLALAPTFTSNDARRYVWDGAAALAGFDPYFYSPRGIAEHVHGFAVPVDNAGYVTLYPPAALATFVLAASFGGKLAPLAWKLLVTSASIATLAVSAKSLASVRAHRYVALVALCPLLVFEAGVGAHVDTFAALAVACGTRAWIERRHASVAAWFALGGLFKLTPALALVPLFFAAPRAARARMLGAGSLVFLGGYGVVMGVGYRPLGSLRAFLTDWRFGSPPFALFERALGTANALTAASLIGVALVALSVVVAIRRDPLRGALVALVAPFVASPVVFPWYLVAQAPLVAHRPSYAWLAWASTLPLTYEVLDRVARGEAWSAGRGPLIAVSLAVAGGLVLDTSAARARRSRDEAHASPADPGENLHTAGR